MELHEPENISDQVPERIAVMKQVECVRRVGMIHKRTGRLRAIAPAMNRSMVPFNPGN
jgi:hypothetical protein